jgi:DNA-binding MarR family transcriptional regulator
MLEGKMKNVKATDQDYNLWIMLEHARSAVVAAREKELSQHGVSMMKAAVLFIVDSIGDEATPAEISRWILRKSHSVSGLLDRMEKDGLIKKTKDLHRKNLVRVTITEKGYKALNKSKDRKAIHRAMAAIPEEERQKFYNQLEKIRDKALRQAGISKPPFPKGLTD